MNLKLSRHSQWHPTYGAQTSFHTCWHTLSKINVFNLICHLKAFFLSWGTHIFFLQLYRHLIRKNLKIASLAGQISCSMKCILFMLRFGELKIKEHWILELFFWDETRKQISPGQSAPIYIWPPRWKLMQFQNWDNGNVHKIHKCCSPRRKALRKM